MYEFSFDYPPDYPDNECPSIGSNTIYPEYGYNSAGSIIPDSYQNKDVPIYFDYSGKTLTLRRVTSPLIFSVPGNTTVEIISDNNRIYSLKTKTTGDLTLTGTGTINTDETITNESGNINIGGRSKINTMGRDEYSIKSQEGYITIRDNAEVSVTDGYSGIKSKHSVEILDNAKFTADVKYDAINTQNGELRIAPMAVVNLKSERTAINSQSCDIMGNLTIDCGDVGITGSSVLNKSNIEIKAGAGAFNNKPTLLYEPCRKLRVGTSNNNARPLSSSDIESTSYNKNLYFKIEPMSEHTLKDNGKCAYCGHIAYTAYDTQTPNVMYGEIPEELNDIAYYGTAKGVDGHEFGLDFTTSDNKTVKATWNNITGNADVSFGVIVRNALDNGVSKFKSVSFHNAKQN